MTETIFPRICARTYYAHPRARVSFSSQLTAVHFDFDALELLHWSHSVGVKSQNVTEMWSRLWDLGVTETVPYPLPYCWLGNPPVPRELSATCRCVTGRYAAAAADCSHACTGTSLAPSICNNKQNTLATCFLLAPLHECK